MIQHKIFASFVALDVHDNNIFDLASSRNRDNCLQPFVELRDYFFERGVKLNSIDTNIGLSVDFELHMDVQKSSHFERPCYLILGESPQVFSDNQDIKYLNKYRRIFTWSDDLVDGDKFIKLNLPNKIIINNSLGWSGRDKLCCLISANKSFAKKTSLDLYSERLKTIRWFERYAPNDFDLFGIGWNMPPPPSGLVNRVVRKLKNYLPKDEAKIHFPSYCGSVVSKQEVFQKYKFSICYENIRDLPGYITEKIWDSFFSGCVPIYWGASNVLEYIPEDCFIDRRKFDTHEKLYKFISSINESEYIAYQERIKRFLSSEGARQFSSEIFVKTIVTVIEKDFTSG